MKYIKDKDIKLTILDKKNIKINFKRVFFLMQEKKLLGEIMLIKNAFRPFLVLRVHFR